MSQKRVFFRSLLGFSLTLLLIGALTAVGPAERTLGTRVRVVYLHGAMVWAALGFLVAAGGAGAAGLLTGRAALHRWSLALGRTGLLLWVLYLPVSVWAMQTNWNGLFLAEPRWRVAVVFAVTGLPLQAGLGLLGNPAWASVLNLGYAAALVVTLQRTANVMHPPAPILNSEAGRIQWFFFGLCALMLLAGAQIARGWHRAEAGRA